MSVFSPWPLVGTSLDTFYNKNYLFHQAYDGEHFLEILLPSTMWNHPSQGDIDVTDSFFGTKSLNIFMAQRPYGWVPNEDGNYTFDWANPGSAYSLKINEYLARWSTQFIRFPFYKTVMYIDMYTARLVQADCPGSDLPEMLLKTASKIQQLCSIAPGFQYGGLIESQVPPEFFHSQIDDFYSPIGTS